MIAYLTLNEEYRIVASKCFLEYHQESDFPISQAGVLKNMANTWNFNSKGVLCEDSTKKNTEDIDFNFF